MKDKKIITQKELNYIETLYLYCNIDDFISGLKLDSYDLDYDAMSGTVAYTLMIDAIEETMLKNARYLGDANGRMWYKFPNYRIGLMEYDKAKRAKQFNCLIQYEQHYMFGLNQNLDDIDLPFGGTRSQYQLKRIDITKIAKIEENYMVNYGYISSYRREDYVNGTIYLGNRKNGNVFRMYDKTKELLTDTKEHPINYKKIDLFSRYFGDIENLYTFELELSRKYLKNTLGINTLEDLSKVYKAYKNIVGQVRFYKDSDRNKRFIKNNHRDRVPCRKLTDYSDYKRVEKNKYKTSLDYAIQKSVKTLDKYLENTGLEKSNENYMKLINAQISSRIDQNKKDMVITFEDTPLSLALDRMTAKHKSLRDNQSNELELEAKRAFA